MRRIFKIATRNAEATKLQKLGMISAAHFNEIIASSGDRELSLLQKEIKLNLPDLPASNSVSLPVDLCLTLQLVNLWQTHLQRKTPDDAALGSSKGKRFRQRVKSEAGVPDMLNL